MIPAGGRITHETYRPRKGLARALPWGTKPMTDGNRPFEVTECESCGAIAVAQPHASACEAEMQPVRARNEGVRAPDLETLVTAVFGMSPTELEVCICVMREGETTTSGLAETLGYDRSVISRHLNHLTDLGVLEKRRLIRKTGGHVYVYSPVDLEDIQRHFKLGLFTWLTDAIDLIEELNREKVEAIAETIEAGSEWRVYADE